MPSRNRCPTCWWSEIATRKRERYRCASGARETWGRSRWLISSRRSSRGATPSSNPVFAWADSADASAALRAKACESVQATAALRARSAESTQATAARIDTSLHLFAIGPHARRPGRQRCLGRWPKRVTHARPAPARPPGRARSAPRRTPRTPAMPGTRARRRRTAAHRPR